MVKEIVKDLEKLSGKTLMCVDMKLANQVVADLIDTANAHIDPEKDMTCVGLASNQIGSSERICIIKKGEREDGSTIWLPLINPVIIDKSKRTFVSEEGCLSLDGLRKVDRYEWVEVMYKDIHKKMHRAKLRGGMCIIVQHEIDHLNGILI